MKCKHLDQRFERFCDTPGYYCQDCGVLIAVAIEVGKELGKLPFDEPSEDVVLLL